MSTVNIDIDLCDPKEARKLLAKAYREKKKQNDDREENIRKASYRAAMAAYKIYAAFHEARELPRSDYFAPSSATYSQICQETDRRANAAEYSLEDIDGGRATMTIYGATIAGCLTDSAGWIMSAILQNNDTGERRPVAIGTAGGQTSALDMPGIPAHFIEGQ